MYKLVLVTTVVQIIENKIVYVYKKIILVLSLLAGAFAISSCIKYEDIQEARIIPECNKLVCNFSLEDQTIQRYTRALRKSKDKILMQEMDQKSKKNGSVANLVHRYNIPKISYH